MTSIIDKLNRRIDAANTLLCVGLDTDIRALPERYRDLELPQFEFNRAIINATHAYAVAYKFNSAFYEARGESGYRELALTMDYLRDVYPDVVTICDAKRADIGSTNQAYVNAIFDQLGFDAVTLHPYLGREALAPFLDRADKASIILCRTSNPGADELQDLVVEDKPLYMWVAAQVAENWNARGNCMLVAGATNPDAIRCIRSVVGDMPLLVPGIGAQGGDLAAVLEAGLTANKGGLIINASRSIMFDPTPDAAARELRDAINRYR